MSDTDRGLELHYARADPSLLSSPFTPDDASDHGAVVRDRATDAVVAVNVPPDPHDLLADAGVAPGDVDAVVLCDDANDDSAVRSLLDAAPDATVVRPAGVAETVTTDRDDVHVVPDAVGSTPATVEVAPGTAVEPLGVVDADGPRAVVDVAATDDRALRATFTGRLDPTAVGEREERSLVDLLGDGVGFASASAAWRETVEALRATQAERVDGPDGDEVRVLEAPPNFTRAEMTAWDPAVTVMRPTRYNDLYFPEFDRPPIGRPVHRSSVAVGPDGTLERGVDAADRDPDVGRDRGWG